MSNPANDNVIELTGKLLGSFLLFTQTFFYLRTGRTFEISNPPGRSSHILTMAEAFTDVFHGRKRHLTINIPPRYSKTEMLIHFVAWAMARVPSSNFLYVSYSHELAAKQTAVIKQIIEMPHYQKLFKVKISRDSRAKDNFENLQGGSVYAAGTGGTITGRGAGIKNYIGFGGCVAIDDSIKPDEATSDTVRERINEWYDNTLQSRLNQADKTPIISVGQRVHEDDLSNKLSQSGKFYIISIPALDIHNNPLHPEMHSREMLLEMKSTMPYVFASQYQQDPIPAGGGIFKSDWFVKLEEEPEILLSFITIDSSETDKTYNDATVFSFFGIYRIKQRDVQTDIYGLHWIDCRELWCEPADLENEFFDFYAQCMRYAVKPLDIIIEKKSTGVTLASILKRTQGLHIIDIGRTKASGSKATRYLEIQPVVASKRVSLPLNGKHTEKCITHMSKITANNTHLRDDIADTLYDGCRFGLIDKILISRIANRPQDKAIAQKIMDKSRRISIARSKAYGRVNR